MRPADKRELVSYVVAEHRQSVRWACCLLCLSRTVFYYQAVPRNDDEIIAALSEMAIQYPHAGFSQMFHRLRNDGHTWNHKWVYRVYKVLKLNLRRKHKRRLPERPKQHIAWPIHPNHSWSMDFMADSLHGGGRFRILNIIDDHNRECLAMEVGTSLPALRVIRTLERLLEWRQKPSSIRVDNGPEFDSNALRKWCDERDIELNFIRPGKPTDNSYIERFNRTVRTELLNAWVFQNLEQVRDQVFEFMDDYNRTRPHQALGNVSPVKFAAQIKRQSGALDRPPNQGNTHLKTH